MGDVIQFPEGDNGSETTRHIAIRKLNELAKQGRLPTPERVVLSRVRHDDHDAVQEIWSTHEKETAPYLKKRTIEELRNLTIAPSQMFSIRVFYRVDGVEIGTLAGHYAMDDRGVHIELCFDRSFIERMGLQKLAIDARLFITAVSLAMSGLDREEVRLYASFDSNNEWSLRNYVAQGAIPTSYLPSELRRDGGTGDKLIDGYSFAEFPPEAVVAAFRRMLDRLKAQRIKIGDKHVAFKFCAEFADVSIVEQLRPQVELLYERYAKTRTQPG